jgi:hypothetical protein
MVNYPIKFQVLTSTKMDDYINRFAEQEGVLHATAARMLIMRALEYEFKLTPEDLADGK